MDFEPFPKIPRLNRDIVVTEKIDGTNAAVLIEDVTEHWETKLVEQFIDPSVIEIDGARYRVQAQSRKRLITPEDDNFGFARWVRENAADLVRLMGPGRYFGEWWGKGIQRGYGMERKVFSLFNPTFRWGDAPEAQWLKDSGEVRTVPVLYEGPFRERNEVNGEDPIDAALWTLRNCGSEAAPGFMNPEGIIVYHTASRGLFKVTCEGDEKPKGSTE